MAELTGKTIAELPRSTSLSDIDLLPIMSGGSSKHVQMGDFRDQFFRIDQGRSANGLNIDELLDPGTYNVSDTTTVAGTQPTTAYLYKLVVQRMRYTSDTPRLWQTAYLINSNCSEYRRYYNGTAWSDWTRVANMSDVTPLAEQLANVAMTQMTVTAGNQQDMQLANNTHGMLIISGYTANLKGQYIVFCSNSGEVSVKAIAEAPTVTLTNSANTLTIANGSTAYGAYCLFVKF